MYNSLIKITLRTIYREKLYALINILGLAMAITVCLILGLYLHSELTYDLHHLNHERIYRVVEEFNNKGQLDSFAVTGASLAPMLANDFDEIEAYVRFRRMPSMFISYQDQGEFWDSVYYADDNVFEIFTHEIIYGDPGTALKDADGIAVSETFAWKYFGNINPVGKIVKNENGDPYTVKTVFADFPENTHLKYDILLSYNNPAMALPGNEAIRRSQLWQTPNFNYLVFKEGFDTTRFEQMQKDFYDRHMSALGDSQGMSMRFWLEPLADIHLNSNLQRDLPAGNLAYLYAFTAVVLFIILVACINYTNLSTARYMRRAREVGMRKILGANRGTLMLQFLSETLLFSLLSAVLALIAVEIILDLTPINQLLDKSLNLSVFDEPAILFWLLLLCLLVGLLSGVYPAFYLSSWLPLSALVSTKSTGKGNIRLRQVLVLIQFTISIAVIACTFLMSNQMRFLSDKSLGFEKENRIVIRLVGVDLIEKIPVIRNELMEYEGILGVTAGSESLGRFMNFAALNVENRDGVMEQGTIFFTQVDKEFFSTMGLKLVEGRDFNQRLLTDVGRNVIVNEAMVRKQGWDEALGKRVLDGRVIGVVEDFHYQSLYNLVDPIAILLFDDNWDAVPAASRPFIQRYLIINISGAGVRDTLTYLEQRFAEFDPVHPFDFQFLDESLDELYRSEERLMELVGVFSGICIFISCLGLFGLASFTTELRTKEIGVRKILGSTTAQIILLLFRGTTVLLVIGGVIASTMAYLAINEWLMEFAYRTEINPLIFIFSVLIAGVIAFMTLVLQSLKTAQANPVQALRYE